MSCNHLDHFHSAFNLSAFSGLQRLSDLRGRRHHPIKVVRGLAIDEVAGGIALPSIDNGEVGEQAALHQIFLAFGLIHFLALGNQRADAGPGA